MKTKNRSLMFMCVAMAFSAQVSVAGVKEGGGGNFIQGRLAEDYQVDPYKKLPGFSDSAKRLLVRVRSVMPALGDSMEEVIRARNWYLIPVSIEVLPKEITGLNFTTEQCAYQNGNDEIFVSEPCIANAGVALDSFYQHEIMMATFHATPFETRSIMNYLAKNPNLDPVRFRDAIYSTLKLSENYHDESLLTKSELDTVHALAPIVEGKLEEICKSEASNVSKLQQLNHLLTLGYANRFVDDQARSEFPVISAPIQAVMEQEGMSGNVWLETGLFENAVYPVVSKWTHTAARSNASPAEKMLAHCASSR